MGAAVASVIPVEHLGPGPIGLGSVSVTEAREDGGSDQPKREERPTPKPMLPPEVTMSEEQERRLRVYLQSEIDSCRWERMEYIDKLSRLKEKHRTRFPEWPKDFPIANSSQLTLPLIKLAVNSLGSRLYQTFMAADPVVSVRTEDEDFQDFAFMEEKFLDLYAKERLNYEEIFEDVMTEAITLGTSVLEVTTAKHNRLLAEYDPLTQQYKLKDTEIHNGPIWYHVPIVDFWIRPAFTHIQTAPWCGKEIRVTWSQIKDMAYNGELDPTKIDRIWNHTLQEGYVPATVKKDEEIERTEPNERAEYSIFELAVRWATDRTGLDNELIVYWHQDSQTLLRTKFNTFKKGRRPWVKYGYIRHPHRFYCEGLAELVEQLQEEISTIHNQRIDNASIANLQIILVAKLIRGLSPGDRLWTGKIVKVGDVAKDVGTLRLGEVYPNTVTSENMTLGYFRELTGASETATGQSQPVTRTTATAQMAMLEELNRRFDKILKGFRRSGRETYLMTADLFSQTGTNGLAEKWLGSEKGRQFEEYLALPDEAVGGRIKLQLTATRSTVNREVEFQSQLALFNLVIQMAGQILPFVQQIPEIAQYMPMVAHEFVKTLKPIFKKVMQYGDAANPDEAVSVLAVLERILPAPEDMGGMAAAQASENAAAVANGRGNGGAQGNGNGTSGGIPQDAEGLSRMGDLFSLLGQANGGRGGVRTAGGNGKRVART